MLMVTTIPANTRRLANAALMLVQRLKRWTSIKAALAKRLVLDGMSVWNILTWSPCSQC